MKFDFQKSNDAPCDTGNIIYSQPSMLMMSVFVEATTGLKTFGRNCVCIEYVQVGFLSFLRTVVLNFPNAVTF